MKRLLFTTLSIVFACAVIAYADGALQTAGTVPIQGFAPNLNTATSAFTKTATYTIPAKTAAIKVQCTNACTLALNGTGTGWPLAAASPETFIVGAGVKTLVFSQTSSASANTAYILRH